MLNQILALIGTLGTVMAITLGYFRIREYLKRPKLTIQRSQCRSIILFPDPPEPYPCLKGALINLSHHTIYPAPPPTLEIYPTSRARLFRKGITITPSFGYDTAKPIPPLARWQFNTTLQDVNKALPENLRHRHILHLRACLLLESGLKVCSPIITVTLH